LFRMLTAIRMLFYLHDLAPRAHFIIDSSHRAIFEIASKITHNFCLTTVWVSVPDWTRPAGCHHFACSKCHVAVWGGIGYRCDWWPAKTSCDRTVTPRWCYTNAVQRDGSGAGVKMNRFLPLEILNIPGTGTEAVSVAFWALQQWVRHKRSRWFRTDERQTSPFPTERSAEYAT
jgi:hypothetical protein